MHTFDIEIIGTYNENCHFMEDNVLTAIAKLGINAKVNCIADIEEVKRRRLRCTPALVIDGRIVSQGRQVSSKKIQSFLRELTYLSDGGDFLSRMF